MGNRCSKSEKNVESVCEQVNGIPQNARKILEILNQQEV